MVAINWYFWLQPFTYAKSNNIGLFKNIAFFRWKLPKNSDFNIPRPLEMPEGKQSQYYLS
jgi:hypothetical protein